MRTKLILRTRGIKLSAERGGSDRLCDALLLLLTNGARQHPCLTVGQVASAGLAAFGRQRRLSETFQSEPPRRIRAHAVCVALPREGERSFDARNE